MDPQLMDLLQSLLTTVLPTIILIVFGWIGARFLGSKKRQAITSELGEAARRALNAIRINNPGMVLLDNIETYRRLVFDALIQDPEVPVAKAAKPKPVMEAINDTIASALEADPTLGGVGHLPIQPKPTKKPFVAALRPRGQ